MSLSRKTFLYSIILAVIMVAFITGYFALMLPSLYVDYVKRNNLESAVDIQKHYMENRSYDGLTVRNPSAVISIEIPNEGDTLYVAGKFFRMTVELQDEELKSLLGELRRQTESVDNRVGGALSGDFERAGFSALSDLWENRLKDKLMDKSTAQEDYPVRVQVEPKEEPGIYREEYTEIHTVSSDIAVFEMGVSDGDYGYTTYLAAGRTGDACIITVVPTLTPRMGEITPIVAESLPMIAAVVFLTVLIAARFFSGKIVRPIIRLAGTADSVRAAGYFEGEIFEEEDLGKDSGDEITALGRALQELYGRLRGSYLELEEKNRFLEEENSRREIFIRASSHQLKTPVAAALLLVEGMINEVGKYKNTREYLPEVKRQLLSMRKIIEDTLHALYLSNQGDTEKKETVEERELVEELVKAYQIQMEERHLSLEVKGRGTIRTNREMLRQILDNLLSNAVQYTPEGEKIEIEADRRKISIRNYGVQIEERLLPGIFDPFVSSDTERKGKGLGLYVAAYYSRLLGYELTLENKENCVRAGIFFGE